MRQLVAILFAVLLAVQGWAISITNIASGSWTNPAIWNPAQIPTFADEAVLTGSTYTVTVHSQPINVGTITLNNGTLSMGSSTGNIASNSFLQLNGNFVIGGSTFEVAGSTFGVRGGAQPIGTGTITLSGNCGITNASSAPLVHVGARNFSLAFSNKTCTSFPGGQQGFAEKLILNGGTLTLTASDIWSLGGTANSKPIVNNAAYTNLFFALPGSVIKGGQSIYFVLAGGATTDVSQIVNVSMTNCYFVLPYNSGGGVNTNTVALFNSSTNISSFNNLVIAIEGQLSISNSVLDIRNIAFLATGVGLLKVTGSRLVATNTMSANVGGIEAYSALSSATYSNSIIATNSTFLIGYKWYRGVASVDSFTDCILTNIGVQDFQWNTGTYTFTRTPTFITFAGTTPLFRMPSVQSLTITGGTYVQLQSAMTAGIFTNSSNFQSQGYQITASNIVNTATFTPSASTLLVDQSLINAGTGVFSQMTSTVQFGTSTNTATCNVPNFYNVLCNTAGKTVNLPVAPPNIVVDTVGGNNGTNINFAQSVVGTNGLALLFNGTNQGIVTTSNYNITANGASLCAWINYQNLATNTFLARSVTSALRTRFYFQVDPSGHLAFFVKYDNNAQYLVTNSTTLASNQWFFVSATLSNNGYVSLFTNGLWSASALTFGPSVITSNPAPLTIGKTVSEYHSGGIAPDYFCGMISKVSIYNRALSSNEVFQVYQGNAPTNGLVAYYPLNDTGSQVIQGTFSSTGAAASNVTWTGGSTLTLSNRAYLYFTSPNLYFSGGKAAEFWDSAGGTNQLGNADYFPR